MRADLFYQSHAEQALPLVLVSKAEWEKGFPEITEAEHRFLGVQQFQAKLGDVCLISNACGSPVKAYIGAWDNNDVAAMAHAASRLPRGCYAPAKPLSQFAMVTWALAQYRFDAFKKQDILPRVLVLEQEKLTKVQTEAEAIFLVRDLINSPSNALGPKEMAAVVAKMANEWGA